MGKLNINTFFAMFLFVMITFAISCNRDDVIEPIEDEEDEDITYTLGETGPAGGIIFYVDENGGGLEAAPADWNGTGSDPSARWGCVDVDVSGTSVEVGSGMANTQLILNACHQDEIAAKRAADLVYNGFDDWYLPSKEELLLLHQNRGLLDSYEDTWYWSSSQHFTSTAWAKHFAIGMPIEGRNKGTATNVRVRPVRSL